MCPPVRDEHRRLPETEFLVLKMIAHEFPILGAVILFFWKIFLRKWCLTTLKALAHRGALPTVLL